MYDTQVNFSDWFYFQEALENHISNLLDSRGYIMFFKKDGQVFGAPEESRIMFARLKTPEKDEKQTEEPGGFLGFNLLRSMFGDMSPNLFGANDLKKIKIIDREDAEKHMKKKATDDDGTEGGNPLRMMLTKMIRIIPSAGKK